MLSKLVFFRPSVWTGGSSPFSEFSMKGVSPLTLAELLTRLRSIAITDGPNAVVAEFADMGEGGNVVSDIVDVVVENGKVVMITAHAI
jgi:hypothetical protein